MMLTVNMQTYSETARRQSAVVLTNKGFTIIAAASIVGCSTFTVSRCRRRMVDTGDIADLLRSGRPATCSETLKLELIGFYCQTQPFPNSGRWTLRWAAIHLAKHPECINASPSKSTIHRILKDSGLKPHQSRYFLHITDPNFSPKWST